MTDYRYQSADATVKPRAYEARLNQW
jgi:hypothetical protein